MTEKIKVYFPNQNKKIFIDRGSSIASACTEAGFVLDFVCGGKGTCKKCQVEIENGVNKKSVLACQEKVYSDLKVFLADHQFKTMAHILTDNIIDGVDFNPSLRKKYIEKETLPLCSSMWEYYTTKANLDIQIPPLPLLQKFSLLQEDNDNNGITLVMWANQVIDIEANNTTDKSYGFAIDIGTTTIAAYLYDLATGKKMGVYSALNGQVVEGGDVITRIGACINKSHGLLLLQGKVIETINQLIDKAVKEHNISNDNIYTMAVCGNSAMQHLFLGLWPEKLGTLPFASVVRRDVISRAEELNLNIHPRGIVHFLPLVGGFVGADTTAVLLSLLDKDTEKMRLIIDLGTNGEIVLGNKDKMLTTSTAAGPALEGAGIQFGMRGTSGAIERVNLSKGMIEYKVIMDERPLGLCGSGLIDAIAEMLKTGLINERGKLLTKDEYLARCKPAYRSLAKHLEKVDNTNVFVLVPERQSQRDEIIYISQKDIRAVQLAKGAIYTGCMLLMKEYGIQGKDLDEILIAGAFGNYIDVKKGQFIGLLPSFEGVPVISIGNAAGAGVQQFLLSKTFQERVIPMIKNIEHVELASNPNFHEEYFRNINFPKYC